MTVRGLLILGFIVPVLVVLGLYWNQHGIERVMRDGYVTTGTITSAAQTSSRFPISFDDGWPRYVDEPLSVGLRWIGKDGVERTRTGIGVSGAFAARILVGNQVKLVPAAIRTIDDESSLPVVIEDANDRLQDIRSKSGFMEKLAAFFAVVLVALIAWQKWSAQQCSPGPAEAGQWQPRRFPVYLALMTAVSLPFGAYMIVSSYLEQGAAAEMLDHGDEASADITRAVAEVQKAGAAPSYLVTLAWTDKSGQRQTFGPTHISAGFWQQITRNDVQTVTKTKIRYLEGRPTVRPLIVGDTAERLFQDRVGVTSGAVFLVLGLVLAGLTTWRFRANAHAASLPPAGT
ncbi:DUF3592 domain-containing protein [Bradyrhizobium sp. CCBAU 53421]|uniref:DUF3592 domain-containing protein n=1 Tax=Bradyrhizobium sp. CCBAU 53421 TaxID=1325120 RepID=UPI00188C9D92|nr:hypothetical protein [Bradyrhizobium sp. CCBAU 53421]QOZ38022.1 hypothetical protein XH92_21125 [Bradyrhizobium sp. CCBAU 53421]